MHCKQILRFRSIMSKQSTLFIVPELIKEPKIEKLSTKPRLNSACRNQYIILPNILDDIISRNHLVRSVWAYVESLDLSIVLGKIRSVENNPGRSSTDPKILLCLWLFSIIKSIGSSRVIESYCNEHDAFKWICGGVNVGYHTISDFRKDHGDQLDVLLTMSVTALASSGIISLEKVSQDGIRVRASAGASSFRREATLNDLDVLSKALVEDLKEEEKKCPGACRTRLAAAKLKAAENRVKRVEQAKSELEKLRSDKKEYFKKHGKKIDLKELEKVRVSTTDPEAKVMKMACGGFRPAFNVQFASTNKGKAIISVDITNKGCDNKQLSKMIGNVVERYGVVPDKWFVDAGYDSQEELNLAGTKYSKCEVYMPVKVTSKNKNLYERQPKDSAIVGKWRNRMGTDEAKDLYKERAATAEFVNAKARNRGLQQFLVTGIKNTKCVALIYALAHNMMIQINQAGFDLLNLVKAHIS
jgi:transposase